MWHLSSLELVLDCSRVIGDSRLIWVTHSPGHERLPSPTPVIEYPTYRVVATSSEYVAHSPKAQTTTLECCCNVLECQFPLAAKNFISCIHQVASPHWSLRSLRQCLHLIALDWIGSAQYGQIFNSDPTSACMTVRPG